MVNQNLRPCLGQPGRAEQSAPVTETEQAPGKNEPGNDQPSPRRTAGSNRGVPPSAVRDERGAGSSGDHKDFPAAAAKLTSAVHPSEKTTVLSLSVTDLLPHTGSARVSYILGSFEKAQSGQNRLGTTASDETVVRIANAFRDYFASENFKPDSISSIINRGEHDTSVSRQRRSEEDRFADAERGGRVHPLGGQKKAASAAAEPRTVVYPGYRAPRCIQD